MEKVPWEIHTCSVSLRPYLSKCFQEAVPKDAHSCTQNLAEGCRQGFALRWVHHLSAAHMDQPWFGLSNPKVFTLPPSGDQMD